jgi:hypothetical protein
MMVRTAKEQAAKARAAGLKRFIADRPCQHGHLERRADARGTCITCHYLRHSPRIVRSSLSVTNTTALERRPGLVPFRGHYPEGGCVSSEAVLPRQRLLRRIVRRVALKLVALDETLRTRARLLAGVNAERL